MGAGHVVGKRPQGREKVQTQKTKKPSGWTGQGGGGGGGRFVGCGISEKAGNDVLSVLRLASATLTFTLGLFTPAPCSARLVVLTRAGSHLLLQKQRAKQAARKAAGVHRPDGQPEQPEQPAPPASLPPHSVGKRRAGVYWCWGPAPASWQLLSVRLAWPSPASRQLWFWFFVSLAVHQRTDDVHVGLPATARSLCTRDETRQTQTLTAAARSLAGVHAGTLLYVHVPSCAACARRVQC